jgi:8-oxo-dGTP pyrophosphatase MutT (NUDIX family)
VSKRKSKRPSGPAGGSVATVDAEVDAEVVAAGGIVHRRRRRALWNRDEIAVVHRPRYDDWSFPKGKRDAGDDDDAATALREVEEETGLRCVIGPFAGETRYRDNRGRDKVVRYWLMTLEDGQESSPFVPNREVDALQWCRPAEAGRLLSYDHDRALLAQVAEGDLR